MAGKRESKSRFWPLLAFALLFPALVSLGIWQLEKGGTKSRLHAAFDTSGEAVDITGMSPGQLAELPDYQRVRVRGGYVADRQLFLDNMPREGRPGIHVLTPLQQESVEWLLIVDRGWLSKHFAQDGGPDIQVSTERREISGRLAPFPQPGLVLNGGTVPADWPKLMQFPQPGDISALFRRPVAGHMLLLDSEAEDGYLRDWRPPGLPPARHYAYAFQWFMLAATLLIIAVVMLVRRRGRESNDE